MLVSHSFDFQMSLLLRLDWNLLALDLCFREGSWFSLFSDSFELRRLESFLEMDLSSLTLCGLAVEGRSMFSKLLVFLTLFPVFEFSFKQPSILEFSLLLLFSLLTFDCFLFAHSFISSSTGANFLLTFLLLSSTASYLTSTNSQKFSKKPLKLSLSSLPSITVSSVLILQHSQSLECLSSDSCVKYGLDWMKSLRLSCLYFYFLLSLPIICNFIFDGLLIQNQRLCGIRGMPDEKVGLI